LQLSDAFADGTNVSFDVFALLSLVALSDGSTKIHTHTHTHVCVCELSFDEIRAAIMRLSVERGGRKVGFSLTFKGEKPYETASSSSSSSRVGFNFPLARLKTSSCAPAGPAGPPGVPSQSAVGGRAAQNLRPRDDRRDEGEEGEEEPSRDDRARGNKSAADIKKRIARLTTT